MTFQQITDLTLAELGLADYSTLAEIAIKGKEFGKSSYTTERLSGQQMCELLTSPAFHEKLIASLKQANDPRPHALVTASDVLKGWQEYDRRFLESGRCNDIKLRYFELCMMNSLFRALIRKGATRDDLSNISSSHEIFEATFFCE